MNVPSSVFLGQSFSFEAAFTNQGATSGDVGYGPFVDVYLPATQGIGTGSITATHLGVPVEMVISTFDTGGEITHPYQFLSTGHATVTGIPGDKLVSIRLPYSGYSPDHPPAMIQFTTNVDASTELGVPLDIRARAGFEDGSTPIADWCCTADVTIVSDDESADDWTVSAPVTPGIMTITKIYSGPEAETATGTGYVESYTISVDIAAGETVEGLTITDDLPDHMQFVGITAASPSDPADVITTPVGLGGTLVYQFASPVTGGAGGSDASVTFEFHIPYDDGATPILSPISGNDLTEYNSVGAVGSWTPFGATDPVVITADCPNCHGLTYKSIAIQKGVGLVSDTGANGYSPGDTVRYTLNFQVSDYFAFEDIVLTDVMADGLLFDTGYAPTYSVNEHGANESGTFIAANYDVAKDTLTDGHTDITFRLSDQLANGQLLGRCVGDTGGLDSACAAGVDTTTGTLTFQAIIQESYTVIDTDDDNQSVDQNDRLDNTITINGRLLDVTTLVANGNNEPDGSGANVTVVIGELLKTIYAINGSTTLPSPLVLAPGDTITYRLTYDLPTSDIEDLSIQDFIPLPVLNPVNLNTFNETATGIPAVDEAQYGPADTFHLIYGGPPTLSVNSASGLIEFIYGEYDSNTSPAETIDLLFTLEVSNEPYDPNLTLTNLAVAQETNSNGTSTPSSSTAAIELAQPVLQTGKSVVATTNPSQTIPTVGGATFLAHDDADEGDATPRWSGSFDTSTSGIPALNHSISGVESGDILTFAILIHNDGGSPKGAFDIQLRDILPADFGIPADGLNLNVAFANGTAINYIPLGPSSDETDFFATGIELVDPSDGLCQAHEFDPDRSFIVITYDLEVLPGVAPSQQLVNGGEVFNYAGSEGGPNHLAPDLGGPISDSVTVEVRPLIVDKSHIAPTHTDPQETGRDFATIGEVYQVELDITIPGQMTMYGDGSGTPVRVVDVIDQEGVAFCDSSSGVTGCADPVLTDPLSLTAFDATTPWSVSTAGTGLTLTFNLDDVDNTANPTDSTFTITYTVLVTGEDDSSNPVFFLPGTGDEITNTFDVHYYNNPSNYPPDAFTSDQASSQIDIDQPTVQTTKSIVRIDDNGGGTVCNDSGTCTGQSVEGDYVLFYETVFENTGQSTAFDISITDNLPDYVSYNDSLTCTYSSPADALSVDNPPAAGVDPLVIDGTVLSASYLRAGQTLTCTYNVTVDPDVPAGSTLTNAVDIDWTTTPGLNPNERDYDDTPADGTADTDSTSLDVEVPDLVKWLDSTTSPLGGTPPEVRIGDEVTYEIRVPLPVGRTQDLVITDMPDTGLAVVSNVLLIENASSSLDLQVSEGPDGSGGYEWQVYDANCTPIGGASDCMQSDGTENTAVLITLTARIADITSNTDGDVLNNTIEAAFTDGSGASQTVLNEEPPLDDEDVLIREPDLSLVKTASVSTADAADAIDYTVTITNDGTAPAYDVVFEENLDDETDFDTGTPLVCTLNSSGTDVEIDIDASDGGSTRNTDGSPDTATSSMDRFFVAENLSEASNGWDLAVGDTLECTYTVIVNQTVQPGRTLTNTVDTDWSSLDGGDVNEREYDDSPDDGSDDTDTTNVNVPDISLDKSADTSIAYQSGELIDYTVTIVLPEGTIADLTVVDAFNTTRTVYESGSARLDGSPLADPTVGIGTLTWNLGDQTVTGTASTTNPPTTGTTLTLTYQMRVINAAPHNSIAHNTVTVTYDRDGNGTADVLTALTNSVDVNIVRPALSTTKTANVTVADAGDTVTYTVTLDNTRNNTVGYDAYFTEDLDVNTDYVPGSMVCVDQAASPVAFQIDDLSTGTVEDVAATADSTLDRFRVAGSLTENSNAWDLDSTETITCTYDVTVNDGVQTGNDNVVNDVDGQFDSADGDQPQERNVTASASDTFAIPSPGLAEKSVDTGSGFYQADGTYQQGDIVPYVILVDMPEGDTEDLTITDTLPGGFEFVGGSTTVSGTSASLLAEPTDGDTLLVWQFDTISISGTDNGAAMTDQITIAFEARVTATAVAGLQSNEATVTFDSPTTNDQDAGTDTADVTLVAPTLSLNKSVTAATPTLVDAGDTVEYEVTITNDGPGVAYDLSFVDVLDTDTAYITNSLACTFTDDSAGTTTPIIFVSSLSPLTVAGSFTEDSNGWDLDVDDSITCTYQVTVDQDVLASDDLVNSATTSGDTSNNDTPGEDTVIDGPVSATVETPDATVSKSVDTGAASYQADGTYAPGQVVPMTITITAPEGAITDLEICDNLPAGLSYDSTASVINSDGTTYTAGVDYTISTGGACDLTYTFSTPLVLDDVANANNATDAGDFKTITIDYLTHVSGSATDGETLANNVTLTYTRGDDSTAEVDTASASVEAEVVTQTTTKAITNISRGGSPVCSTAGDCNGVRVFATDVLGYTLTLTNTHATAVAYDATLSDVLSAGVSYNGDLSCEVLNPDGALSTSAPSAGANPLVIDASVIGTVDLVAGQSLSCTYTATVQNTVSMGDVLANTVTGAVTTASGTPTDDQTVEDTASDSAIVASPEIAIDKTPDSQYVVNGDNASFTLTVTNPGDVDLSGIIVTDATCDVGPTYTGGDDNSDNVLQPGEVWTYSCDVPGATLTFTNTADASGTPAVGPAVTDNDSADAIVINPAIAIAKTPAAQTINSGTDVVFTLTVTNPGDIALANVAVTDATCDVGPTRTSGDTNADNLLQTTETWVYSCTVLGVSADLTNMADVSGTPPAGPDVTDSDSATVDVLPTINVTKSASPVNLPEDSGDVTFTVDIDNTSGEAVTLTSLIDDVYGDLDGTGNCSIPQNIAAGDSYSCQFTETLSGDAGDTHTNTVEATAEDDESNEVSDSDSATVNIIAVVPAADVNKSATPSSLPEPGGSVTFSVTVTNTTSEELNLTSLVDDVHGDLNGQGTCSIPQSLAPLGGSYSCSFTVTIAGNAFDSETDTITATVEDDELNSVDETGNATVSITDVLPAIDVTKTAFPASLNEPGGTVTFSVAVANTTVEPLTLTSLTDDIYGDLDGQGSCSVPQTIASGASYSCSFDRTVTGAGSYTDVVSATVEDDDGNELTKTDDATVTVLEVLDVTKSHSPGTVSEPGGTVTFTVDVLNTSGASFDLTSLTDDVYGDLNGEGSCSIPQTVASGATYSCSFDGTITGNAGDVHTNIVTATADTAGGPASATDDDSVTVSDVLPTITIAKTPDVGSLPEPGGTVTFTVEVTNNSVETVTLTGLTDDVYGDLNGQGSCATGGTIASTDTYSCTFIGAVSGDAGDTHTNTVQASAQDDEGNTATDTDDATVLIGDFTALTIDVSKTASPTSLNEPGGTVTFTVVVANTSPEEVTLTALTDDVYSDLNGQGTCSVPQTIAVGGNYTCAFNVDITGNGGDTHTNTVTVTASDNEANSTSGSDSATVNIVDVLPTVNVTKTPDRSAVNEPGGDVSFTVTVENTNTAESLTLDSLVDDMYGDLNGQGTCSVPQTIAVGNTYACAFTKAISAAAGTTHTNTVSVAVSDDDGNIGTGNDSADVAVLDVLDITKTATPSSITEAGATVTFDLTVANTGTLSLTVNSLIDDVYGDLNGQGTCSVPQTIAAGNNYTCSFTSTMSGNAGDTHTDVITVEATDTNGDFASDSDDATVTITDVLPTLTVTKTANPISVDEPGASVTFTVVVQNTSIEEVTLTDLTDDVYGDLDGEGTCATGGTIAAGDSYTCTFTQIVSGNAGDSHTDTVEATIADDDSNTASASDDATVLIADVLPDITVSKTPSSTILDEPGGTITFTVDVTNNGPEPLTLTALTDDQLGNLNGEGTCTTPQTIMAGGTYSCAFSVDITGAPADVYGNTVTAEVSDDDGNDASDDATASVTLVDVLPDITVSKTPGVSSVDEPGDTVSFTVSVVNNGPELLSLTTLIDDQIGDLNGQGTCSVPQTIAIGGTYTCAFSTDVTGNGGDVYSNTVTVEVSDDDGNDVFEDAVASVTVSDVLPTIFVSKEPDTDEVEEPGEDVTFTLTVRNTSPEAVTLTSLVDDEFGNLDGEGTCSVPQTLPVNGVYECSFEERVSGDAGDTHHNTVTATVEDDDGNEVDESADAEVEIIGETLSCVGGTLFNDEDRDGVQDSGEQGFADVRVFLRDEDGDMVDEDVTDDNGFYSFSNVPPGDYRLEIDEATLPDGVPLYITPDDGVREIELWASDSCRNAKFALILIDPAITKSGSPQTAAPGDTVTFTITAENDSSVTLNNVVVTDPLSGYLEFLGGTTSQGTVSHDPATNVVTFNIGQMSPGQIVLMTVNTRVRLDVPRPLSITNRATMTSTEGEDQASPTITISVPGTSTSTPSQTDEPTTGATRLPDTGLRAHSEEADLPLSTIPLVALGVLAAAGFVLVGWLLATFWRRNWRISLLVVVITLVGAGAALLVASPFQSENTVEQSLQPDAGAQNEVSSADAPVPARPTPLASNTNAEESPQIVAQDIPAFDPADDPATRIVIPALELDVELAEALLLGDTWDVSAYDTEVAHLEGTAYPGAPGNAVVAGHVTYRGGLGPFVALHKLNPGDLVVALGEKTSYVYRVEWTKTVAPTEVDVTGPSDQPLLTLITCTDWSQQSWSYENRLVVRAKLVDVVSSCCAPDSPG